MFKQFFRKRKFIKILKELAPNIEATQVVWKENSVKQIKEFTSKSEAVDFFLTLTREQKPIIAPIYDLKGLIDVNNRYV